MAAGRACHRGPVIPAASPRHVGRSVSRSARASPLGPCALLLPPQPRSPWACAPPSAASAAASLGLCRPLRSPAASAAASLGLCRPLRSPAASAVDSWACAAPSPDCHLPCGHLALSTLLSRSSRSACLVTSSSSRPVVSPLFSYLKAALDGRDHPCHCPIQAFVFLLFCFFH